MALQEQLDKFKKQQEKCQTILASIAASNKAQLANARAPVLAVKFSKSTEWLQLVNSIRKTSTGVDQALNYDGKGFSYKFKHDVKDRNQLLQLIRNFLDGIAVSDLMDAYPSVVEDLQVDGDLKRIFREI
ncbi:hypothetical protein L6164_030926 [Bauhinia variegata]|uniref:Uncharacterized protein n=1 Tax=Bauhinia variegata TaxID=167791 RepID=A0ACB9LE66_BAUVA|nr:hypothetical protein L6164_030926 [Bauhinia variegata]